MPDDGVTAGVTATPRPPVAPTGRPVLCSHVRLRFDRTREGPESVIVLNPTGADILGLCDGNRTVSDVAAALQERYDRVVDDEVAAFLARLVSKRCLEIHDGQ